MPEAGALVVGVDAGGTKTDALVCAGDGRVLGAGRAGAGNWEGIGTAAALAAFESALDAALAAAGARRSRLSASCFALAGLDWPADVEMLDAAIARLGLGGRRAVVNDSFAALRAGCREAHGCVSVAGTGGVAAGRNRAGETFRTMAIGWGEANGAGGLVEAAVDAVARHANGAGEPTALGARLADAMGAASVDDLFRRGAREGRLPRADLAPLVIAAAADADAVAVRLVEQQGALNADTVLGVARRLDMLDDTFELVRSGGLHRAGSALFDGAFDRAVHAGAPAATIVALRAPPVIGAALLALELLGPVAADLHDRLAGEVAA